MNSKLNIQSLFVSHSGLQWVHSHPYPGMKLRASYQLISLLERELFTSWNLTRKQRFTAILEVYKSRLGFSMSRLSFFIAKPLPIHCHITIRDKWPLPFNSVSCYLDSHGVQCTQIHCGYKLGGNNKDANQWTSPWQKKESDTGIHSEKIFFFSRFSEAENKFSWSTNLKTNLVV